MILVILMNIILNLIGTRCTYINLKRMPRLMNYFMEL